MLNAYAVCPLPCASARPLLLLFMSVDFRLLRIFPEIIIFSS